MSSVLTESFLSFAVKCLVAVCLGAVIGAQREFSPYLGMFLVRARRTAVAPVRRAGLRTHVLVALGACLFTEASWSAFAVPAPAQFQNVPFVAGAFNYDTSRVAAQVVSGIGFLGAGTIWRSSFGTGDGSKSGGNRDEVYGLTTAASLWTTAAVGMHCGGANQKDKYFAGPVFATALVVITLQALVHAELAVHAMAFDRTTQKVGARVTVEAEDKKAFARGERSYDERNDDDSSSANQNRFRPGDVMRAVVAAVERRGTLRVVSVGASVDLGRRGKRRRRRRRREARFSSENKGSGLAGGDRSRVRRVRRPAGRARFLRRGNGGVCRRVRSEARREKRTRETKTVFFYARGERRSRGRRRRARRAAPPTVRSERNETRCTGAFVAYHEETRTNK